MTRGRVQRITYYGLLSLLAGGWAGSLLWLIWAFVTNPKAYWVFVVASGLIFARTWIVIGMAAGGAIGTLAAAFVLLLQKPGDRSQDLPVPNGPRPAAVPSGCLVATAVSGGCTGVFLGGVIAIALYLIAVVVVWLFLVGIEPETLFEPYGGPVNAAIRLILEFGGMGIVLGLAAGYIVGYTPTEIACLRTRGKAGRLPKRA